MAKGVPFAKILTAFPPIYRPHQNDLHAFRFLPSLPPRARQEALHRSRPAPRRADAAVFVVGPVFRRSQHAVIDGGLCHANF